MLITSFSQGSFDPIVVKWDDDLVVAGGLDDVDPPPPPPPAPFLDLSEASASTSGTLR